MDNAAFGNSLARQIRDSQEQQEQKGNNPFEATMSDDTVVPQFESMS